MLIAVLLNKTHLHRPKYVFIEFTIDFRPRDLVCPEASNSEIASIMRNILTKTLFKVLNLLHSNLLNKSHSHRQKYVFIKFSIVFRLRDVACPEATNSEIVLKIRNILIVTFCTVMLLIDFLNKRPFTTPKTFFCVFDRLSTRGLAYTGKNIMGARSYKVQAQDKVTAEIMKWLF